MKKIDALEYAIENLKNERSKCSNYYTKKSLKLKEAISVLSSILNAEEGRY